jgi:hypothetical protein
MNKRYLFLLALLGCLTGCVPVDSLNPLYSDSDLVSDDALIGQWTPVDQSQERIIFQFERAKGPSYILQIIEKDKSDKLFYVARLVAIGKNRFLDVSPADVHIPLLNNPVMALQSKSGKNLEPPIFHLGLGSYFELAGSTEKEEANVKAAHWLFRFRLNGKKLSLDGTDDEKFLEAMQNNKFHIDTGLERGRNVLITASTKDLQNFVTEHLDDNSFFTQHVPEIERISAH